MTKIQNLIVWDIGAWNLGIICYLLFGTWIFVYSD